VLKGTTKWAPQEGKDRLDLTYGPEADVWAVGVLAYELLMGGAPFKGTCGTKRWRHIDLLFRKGFPFFLSCPQITFACACFSN
jgi:serine/threonine protein kinase